MANNGELPPRKRENRDWSRLIDQPMAPGVKMKNWSKGFIETWVEVRQGAFVRFQGVVTGAARTVQTQVIPENAEVWGTLEAAGESLDIHIGQELVITGVVKETSCRFTALQAARQDTGLALRRNSMPAQDPITQALSTEVKEANLTRIKNGELVGADVVSRLPDFKLGPYMIDDLHSVTCDWPTTLSTARFYAGDLPLYPGPLLEAQEAIDALNAQTTTDARRKEFAKLAPEIQKLLTDHFGRDTVANNLAKSRRGDLHEQLRQVQFVTHQEKFTGKKRLRIYEWEDRALRPDWLKAWLLGRPRYDRFGAVYVVEERP